MNVLCPSCHGSGQVWLDDDDHPKGGLMVRCLRCRCEECGHELEDLWGACPRRCGEADPHEGTARAVGER